MLYLTVKAVWLLSAPIFLAVIWMGFVLSPQSSTPIADQDFLCVLQGFPRMWEFLAPKPGRSGKSGQLALFPTCTGRGNKKDPLHLASIPIPQPDVSAGR